jgi:hypothetical protein
LWRILVDGIRQFARKSSEKFLLGQPCLPRQGIQNVGSDRLLQLDRGDGLVRSRSYPGFGGLTLAILFETVDKLREPATEDPTGCATGEITAELLQHTGEAAALASRGGRPGARLLSNAAEPLGNFVPVLITSDGE